jgi:hypothetical protein
MQLPFRVMKDARSTGTTCEYFKSALSTGGICMQHQIMSLSSHLLSLYVEPRQKCVLIADWVVTNLGGKVGRQADVAPGVALILVVHLCNHDRSGRVRARGEE